MLKILIPSVLLVATTLPAHAECWRSSKDGVWATCNSTGEQQLRDRVTLLEQLLAGEQAFTWGHQKRLDRIDCEARDGKDRCRELSREFGWGWYGTNKPNQVTRERPAASGASPSTRRKDPNPATQAQAECFDNKPKPAPWGGGTMIDGPPIWVTDAPWSLQAMYFCAVQYEIDHRGHHMTEEDVIQQCTSPNEPIAGASSMAAMTAKYINAECGN